jgi:hypothetical protein
MSTIRGISYFLSTAVTMILTLWILAVLTGCGTLPPPQSPAASACAWERAAVEATGAAVAALDAAARDLPEDTGAEVRTALDAARAVVVLGRASVALCDDARDRPHWWTWAGDALAALSGVVEVLREAGVPYTREVGVAVAVVQATLAAMAPPPTRGETCPIQKGGNSPPTRAELDEAVRVLEAARDQPERVEPCWTKELI